jgi:hypothetical protein
MPSKPLINPVYEHFARNIAYTGQRRRDCLQRARVACGLPEFSPSVASARSTQIAQLPEVAKRIDELRHEELKEAKGALALQHRAVATRDWIIDGLVENVRLAKAEKNYSAVNKSLHLLGLEVGMFATVIKHGTANDVEQLTDAELHAIARGDHPASGGNGADPTATDQTKLN